MKRQKREQPYYGCISADGSRWTVYCTPGSDTDNVPISGAGAFPFDKYPDIPVIDFRTGSGFPRYIFNCGECSRHSPRPLLNLTRLLELCQQSGATIINPPGATK